MTPCKVAAWQGVVFSWRAYALELKRRGAAEMEKAQTLLLQDLEKIKRMKGDLRWLNDSLDRL